MDETTMHWSRSTTYITLAVGIVFAGSTACTFRKAAIPPRDVVVVGLTAGPSTIDPRHTTDATGSRVAGLLFSSLVRPGPDLMPIGDAAIDWTFQNQTYLFHLRPGLVFSNGRPVTKDDLDFSFDEFRSSRSAFASVFENVESIETRYDQGGRSVQVKMKRPSATFLGDLAAIKILPRLETTRLGADFASAPVGTGPFKLKRQTVDEIELEAVVSHPYAAPKTKTVLFKVIRDDNTRMLKLLRDEIDLLQQELPPTKVRTVEKAGGFTILKSSGLSMTYLLLNLENPFLKTLDVRKALAKSVNRDEIIRYKLEDMAQAATSLLTPINPFFDADLVALSFSAAAAQAQLASVGYEIPELTLKTSSAPAAVENARVIAYQLNKVGFHVKIQSHEWATFYGDVQAGHFQMALMRWVGTIDPDLYRKAFHSAEFPPRGRNRGHYANPHLDSLLEAGAQTLKLDQRRRIYNEVQKSVLQDLPIIPLWYDTEVSVLNPRLKGYYQPRSGDYWALTGVYKE